MQVTETQSDGLKREFKVVVDADEIDEKIKGRLQEIGQQARIPGFRPGKAPLNILRQRFGQAVLGEVLEKAVNDSSQQAMVDKGLRPAQQPQIEVESFDEGKPLEYKMSMELLPDIEPMDFSQIELERLKVTIPDSEVDEALERLAQHQKESKPLDEPRPAEKGDVLVVDFKGTVDGEEYPGMSAEDHHLELGSSRFVEGFEDQLIGVQPGEDREVKVTFPSTYVNEQLAGKEAVFQVHVKEIRTTEPVQIDDELAKKFGEEDLNSLKERVREQIAQDYQNLARTRLKRQLLDKLAEGHSFDVPPTMVEEEFDQIWRQIENDRAQGQLDPEDQNKSEEQLKEDYRKIAERRVRLGLLLSEVGQKNNIEVTQDELNNALVQEVQRHPGHEREVFEYYQKDPNALAQLRAPVYEDKVIDYILELAQVSDREVTPDQLRAELEAESGQSETEGDDKSKSKKKSSGSKSASAKSGGSKSGGSKGSASKSSSSKSGGAKSGGSKKSASETKS